MIPSSNQENYKRPSLGQQTLLFVVAATVIVFDQLSKLIVENNLTVNHSWAPIPQLAELFKFTHVHNTGAAFGFFDGGGSIFAMIAVFVAMIIIYYNYSLPAGFHPLRMALGLQLGGAMGNLIDRIRLGHVTDFLDFGPWYIFNFADASIVMGVVILGLLMWQEERTLRANESMEQGELPA